MLFFPTWHLRLFLFSLNMLGVLSDLMLKNGSRRGRTEKGLKVEQNRGFARVRLPRCSHLFAPGSPPKGPPAPLTSGGVRSRPRARLRTRFPSPRAGAICGAWRNPRARAAVTGLTCASWPPAPRRPPPPRPGPAHWLPLGGEEKGRPRGSH